MNRMQFLKGVHLSDLSGRQCPHSRFGHYFYSNLYGRAPGVPGVSKIRFFFTNKTVEFLR